MACSPLLLFFAGLFVGTDTAALLHRRAQQPVEKDSEQHIPQWRADGTLQFIPREGEAPVTSVSIEVPRTFSKFMEGLMWRKEISDGQGMIFQWNQDGPRAFWMENTYIGLDIVYVNQGNKIVSIKKAKPLDLASVPSSDDASYAIEVALGWCEHHGISVGDSVKLNLNATEFYVAKDARHFGATAEEVQQAVKDGSYVVDPN